ncbi:uncharacterized protein LOC114533023 [Dendronephthya gigantea]|uniref:uncharacterized protein LOC114533023 n=1 Tax=Dendronephthya gigantea TaxID=151771 RepID=UPI001068F0F8|nr:uncharacterized protein LOC114533023 [Dendronephthya gigantea]
MSSLYSTLFNAQGPRQNPTQFHPGNRTEETITNYEQLYVYNSHPVLQRTHEPNMYAATSAGWPGNISRTPCNNVPSTFLEQIQAKNQLLVKNKNVMEKQATYISHLEKQLEGQNTSSDLIRRLQDRERDVEHLRARLETEIAPKYEVENLRRNLGEAEYELEKTEKALQETLNDKAVEVNTLEEKVN